MADSAENQTLQRWVAGKTRNGKTLVIKANGTGLFYIEMEGGGKKPRALHGEFTGVSSAQEIIDRYLISASYVHKRNARRKAEEGNDAKKSD